MSGRGNKGGRAKGPPFIRIEKALFHSIAYRACSLTERAILTELIDLYDGRNNGSLWLGTRDAAKRIGVSDHHTAAKALNALLAKGLIAVSAPGAFGMKVRHATCYRLTFEATAGHGPTNDWRRWQPIPGTPEAKRVAHVVESKLRCDLIAQSGVKFTTEPAIQLSDNCSAGVKFTTAPIEIVRQSPAPSGVNNNTHIVCHPVGEQRASIAACNSVRQLARQWLNREGNGAQKRLAALSGLTQSKLCRFMGSEKTTLTDFQADALRAACLQAAGARNLRAAA